MNAIVDCMCQTPLNLARSFGKRRRLKQQRRQFNATSTYALFSDIPTPYFAGAYRLDADVVDRRMTSISDRLRGKDRAVAWFVTHCSTSSKRERYNTAQNKHIYLVCDAELLLARCSHVIAQYVVLPGTRRQANPTECRLNHDAHRPVEYMLTTHVYNRQLYILKTNLCREFSRIPREFHESHSNLMIIGSVSQVPYRKEHGEWFDGNGGTKTQHFSFVVPNSSST